MPTATPSSLLRAGVYTNVPHVFRCAAGEKHFPSPLVTAAGGARSRAQDWWSTAHLIRRQMARCKHSPIAIDHSLSVCVYTLLCLGERQMYSADFLFFDRHCRHTNQQIRAKPTTQHRHQFGIAKIVREWSFENRKLMRWESPCKRVGVTFTRKYQSTQQWSSLWTYYWVAAAYSMSRCCRKQKALNTLK